MPVVAFDTLKLAERLQAGGFTQEQARTAALAFADTVMAADVTTKADLRESEERIKTELKAETSDIRSELKLLEQRVIIKLGGMAVVITGILLAAIRYLPPASSTH